MRRDKAGIDFSIALFRSPCEHYSRQWESNPLQASICRARTGVDQLWSTAAGRLPEASCEGFKNPKSRHEVDVQFRSNAKFVIIEKIPSLGIERDHKRRD